MRVIAVVACVVLAACATCSAAFAAPWHYGARLGGGMTNIHGEFAEIAGPEWRFGYTAGGYAEYEIAPSFSLGLEALYVTKGAHFEGETTDPFGNPVGSSDADLKLSYIEIPLVARVGMAHFEKFHPYVVAGPTLDIALSARSELEDGPSADLSDDLQSPDLGVLAGIGARFPTGSMMLGLEFRYGTSFTDLWDIDNNLESINHGFSLTASLGR